MATVGDGVKIGLGLLLFKFLLGGGCVALGIATCAIMSASSKNQSKWEPMTPPVESVSAPNKDEVSFRNGCNVRADANEQSAKIGYVKAGVRLQVKGERGKWRRVVLDDGTEGWVGCAITKKGEEI
jgi:SH3-like domain-containing protein